MVNLVTYLDSVHDTSEGFRKIIEACHDYRKLSDKTYLVRDPQTNTLKCLLTLGTLYKNNYQITPVDEKLKRQFNPEIQKWILEKE